MKEPTETDKVLVEMLTENTGRSFLDSGSAYGRNWERNQGKIVEDFLSKPAASWGYSGEYVVLDVFHFLRDRLEYDAELDAAFEEWANEEMPDDHWMACMEAFAEKWTEEEHSGNSWDTVNTYNGEDSLSQVLQYVQINEEDGEWIFGDLYLVQIHGGCDVRGGYTRPRVFRGLNPYGEAPLLENNDFSVSCTGMKTVQVETLPGWEDNPEMIYHSWDFRGGECCDSDGSYISYDYSPLYNPEWDDNAEAPFCPECAEKDHASHLQVHTY